MANQINTLSPVRPFSVSHDKGDRVNDIHLTNEEKRHARQRVTNKSSK